MERDNVKSYENLCKIFEMRIKLDRERKSDTSEEVLSNYEKYSKKIDSINNMEFQQKVKPLVKPAGTLEKEKERLENLVTLLKERLSKREELEDKYYSTTGRYISNLQPIVSEDELNGKQDRLELINEYFKNNSEIENITTLVAKLKNDLDEEENRKEDYLVKNNIMESELSSIFIDSIKRDEYYHNLDIKVIDKELASVHDKASEAKETLDVTRESVDSLSSSGIDGEYSSYVDEAAKGYYVWKNREITLKIYSFILEKLEKFLELYNKRSDIKKLIDVRKELRSELGVDTYDELSLFEKTLLEQISTLEDEKKVLENISNYSNEIKFNEEKLEELEEDNNSLEMLALLKEYGIIDVYEAGETPSFDTLKILDEDSLNDSLLDDSGDSTDNGSALTLDRVEISKEEPIINEVIDPYRIIDVSKAPSTLNVGLAKLKGESIREKVSKKLNAEIKKKEESELIISPSENDYQSDIQGDNNNIIDNTSNLDNSVTLNTNMEVKTDEANTSLPPIFSIPNLPESKEELPMWNMSNNNSDLEKVDMKKSQVSPSKDILDNDSLWSTPKSESSSLQEDNYLNLWKTPTDTQVNSLEDSSNKFEMGKEEEIGLNNKSEEKEKDNFWVPVDDAKLETNEFPSINIPIQTNFNGTKDNFGFPNIEGINNNFEFLTIGGENNAH